MSPKHPGDIATWNRAPELDPSDLYAVTYRHELNPERVAALSVYAYEKLVFYATVVTDRELLTGALNLTEPES